jgi:predicted S18 family serine protease
MKIAALLLIFLLSISAFASPLIFQTTLNAGISAQLLISPSINTRSTSRVRILVKRITPTPYISPSDGEFSVDVSGTETGVDFALAECRTASHECVLLVDTPPSSIRVTVTGKGKYRIMVWGK